LSGRQQQMTALARAMAAKPRVLLLDEPCLGLAEAVARRVYDWLREMTETDMTILLVEETRCTPCWSPTGPCACTRDWWR